MMGTKGRSFAQLIHISLEKLVLANHVNRYLECMVDLSFVGECVQEIYANKGCLSIDLVVFFKLQLVMFFEDIRSQLLLMHQLRTRWYLDYDLDDPLPKHASLSHIRIRYGLDIF